MGLKTTNAKAKPFQTPGTSLVDNEAKIGDGKGFGLKAKLSHGEANKLAVLEDLKDSNESEEEIEYMPPRAKGICVFIIRQTYTHIEQNCLTYQMTCRTRSISRCSKMVEFNQVFFITL